MVTVGIKRLAGTWTGIHTGTRVHICDRTAGEIVRTRREDMFDLIAWQMDKAWEDIQVIRVNPAKH